jgi:hypothetical protein
MIEKVEWVQTFGRPCSIEVLLGGETDSYVARYKEVPKVEKSKPAKTLSDKGLNICVRVGSSNIAARI